MGDAKHPCISKSILPMRLWQTAGKEKALLKSTSFSKETEKVTASRPSKWTLEKRTPKKIWGSENKSSHERVHLLSESETFKSYFPFLILTARDTPIVFVCFSQTLTHLIPTATHWSRYFHHFDTETRNVKWHGQGHIAEKQTAKLQSQVTVPAESWLSLQNPPSLWLPPPHTHTALTFPKSMA